MRRDRRIHRLATVAFLALAGFGLGACEQMADMIPDSKKPLPGERKLLFPEGVPGVSQGVPPELMRSNQQASQPPQGQPGAPADAQPQQAAEPAQQQAEEKPKPKPKPKVQRAARQQLQEQAEPAQQQQQQTSPWPSPQQQPPTQASPWPSAPSPGTFTR